MSSAEDTLRSLHDNGPKVIALAAVMVALATGAVALRYVSKLAFAKEFGIDDIFVGISLVFYLATGACVMEAINSGRKAVDGKSAEYEVFMKLTWWSSNLVWSPIAFAILGISALYRRVFYVHRFFRISSLILVWVTVFWWVAGTVTGFLSYDPIQAYWDSSIPGMWRYNYPAFWLSLNIVELLLWTFVLALPILEIMRLNVNKKEKALVMSIFCTGGFVIITGIIRIHYVFNKVVNNDVTTGTIWLCVHLGAAIISVCLPTYKPLFTRARQMATTYDSRIPDELSPSTQQSPRPWDNFPRSSPTETPKIAVDHTSPENLFNAGMVPQAAKLSPASHDTISSDAEQQSVPRTYGRPRDRAPISLAIPSPELNALQWEARGVLDADKRISTASGGTRTRRADLEYPESPVSSQVTV